MTAAMKVTPVSFWVPVAMPLVSKSNFRRGGASEARAWQANQMFEELVRVAVLRSRPAAWVNGEADAKVSARPAVAAVVAAVTTLDASNLSKSVLDACQTRKAGPVVDQGLFWSDASVLHVVCTSWRKGTEQHFRVGFVQVPPGTPMRDLVSAASDLQLEMCGTWLDARPGEAPPR